jgi:hypothetical protein
MASVLERIASGQLDADKATELAKKVLTQQPASVHGGTTH